MPSPEHDSLPSTNPGYFLPCAAAAAAFAVAACRILGDPFHVALYVAGLVASAALGVVGYLALRLRFGQRLSLEALLTLPPPRSALETQAEALAAMAEEAERKAAAAQEEPSAPNITRNIDQVRRRFLKGVD